MPPERIIMSTNDSLGSRKQVILKTFFAGGVAGCCAKTSIAPLDRVKVLLQAHHRHYKHLGVFHSVLKILNKEGFTGLFRGNGAQMVRIFPYAAVQYTGFENYKKFLQKIFGKHSIIKLFAGSLAGLTAVLATYPLDMIRARLAFQVKGELLYSGIGHALSTISRQEGIRGLYRGIVPTILGMTPYAGLSFYTFESLKNYLLETLPQLCSRYDQNGNLILVIPAKLLCGGIAGVFAQTVAYPLDVVRRRMQLGTMISETHNNRHWYTYLVFIFRKDGVRRGLYRGLSVNYVKAGPMVAVSFCTFELVKQSLGLDTSVDR